MKEIKQQILDFLSNKDTLSASIRELNYAINAGIDKIRTSLNQLVSSGKIIREDDDEVNFILNKED